MNTENTSVNIDLMKPTFKAAFKKAAKDKGLSMNEYGHYLLVTGINKKPLVGATAKNIPLGKGGLKAKPTKGKIPTGKTIKATAKRVGASRRRASR